MPVIDTVLEFNRMRPWIYIETASTTFTNSNSHSLAVTSESETVLLMMSRWLLKLVIATPLCKSKLPSSIVCDTETSLLVSLLPYIVFEQD